MQIIQVHSYKYSNEVHNNNITKKDNFTTRELNKKLNN